MKKIYLILVLFCFMYNNVIACELDETDEQKRANILQTVQKFKNAIATDNPKVIANYIKYPFERKNPIPNINDKESFIAKYDSLFDDELKKTIIEAKDEDWQSVGWRGIMLHSGLLWLNEKGQLIAINALSKKERDYTNKWMQKDKDTIYPSLKDFFENILIFNTLTYLGRIDKIKEEGFYQYSYRLSLWDKNSKMSEKPLIVVDKGEVEFFGSAGNHTYTFINKDKGYSFDVTYVGPRDSIPYKLNILEDDRKTFSEEALILK